MAKRDPSGASQGTDMIRAMIESNPRDPLRDILAELYEARPGKQSLKKAATKDPIGYMKAIRQIADPLVPKEIHSTHTDIDAKDVIAEMRDRGLVDDRSMQTLARSVGTNVIEGDAEDVTGESQGEG